MNAHRHSIDQLVKCGDGRESLDVGCRLHLGVPRLDDLALANNGVGRGFSVVREEHALHIPADAVPHGQHVLGIGIVAVLWLRQTLGGVGKATAREVVGNVTPNVVKALKLGPDILVKVIGLDSDDVFDDLRNQCGARGRVERQCLEPVGREQAVNDVLHGHSAVGGHNQGFLDEMCLREMDAHLVPEKVGDLRARLRIAPWPVMLLTLRGVRWQHALVEDGNRCRQTVTLVIGADGDGVQLAGGVQLEESDGGATPAVIRLGLLVEQDLILVDSQTTADVTRILDIQCRGINGRQDGGPFVVTTLLCSGYELVEEGLWHDGNTGWVGAGEGLVGEAAIGEPVRQQANILPLLDVCRRLAVRSVVLLDLLDSAVHGAAVEGALKNADSPVGRLAVPSIRHELGNHEQSVCQAEPVEKIGL